MVKTNSQFTVVLDSFFPCQLIAFHVVHLLSPSHVRLVGLNEMKIDGEKREKMIRRFILHSARYNFEIRCRV